MDNINITYVAIKTVPYVISSASHSVLKCSSIFLEVKFQIPSFEPRKQLGTLYSPGHEITTGDIVNFPAVTVSLEKRLS